MIGWFRFFPELYRRVQCTGKLLYIVQMCRYRVSWSFWRVLSWKQARPRDYNVQLTVSPNRLKSPGRPTCCRLTNRRSDTEALTKSSITQVHLQERTDNNNRAHSTKCLQLVHINDIVEFRWIQTSPAFWQSRKTTKPNAKHCQIGAYYLSRRGISRFVTTRSI